MRAALALAAALLVAATIAVATASADPVNGSDANGTYLALGDSVAFGYVPPDAVPAPNYFDAHSFVGYPEFLAQQLNERVSNASCPGETTASMLVAGAPSNGCENSLHSSAGYSTLYPLHVQYQGTQMQYALHYLATHKHTQLITIDIGANDAFLCQQTAPHQCSTLPELVGVATEIETNLAAIYHELRVDAGYTGTIVALSYYSLSYTDPTQLFVAHFLNGAIGAAGSGYDVDLADGFGAFAAGSGQAGDPCAAGLLIRLPDGTCNIHPSAAGHRLLAAAIAQAIGA